MTPIRFLKRTLPGTLAFLGLLVCCQFNAFGQLLINASYPADTLVARLVGPSVTFSNVITNGVTPTAFGTFSCSGSCNLGFADGIILTSGSAAIAGLSNTGTGQGAAINNLSDPQLTTLTTGATKDACVIEFDFWVANDKLKFDYIFASDEYDDYVNSQFNDVFGFFMSGPGIAGQKNVALIPGTSTPVAINNVNNGGPVGHGVPPPGPCNNCQYYISNTVPPLPKTTAYDGLTTPLTAEQDVCPCETYHIKLAISDVGDQVFDSGVFLEGKSFTGIGQIPIYVNGVPQLNNATYYVCVGDSVELSIVPQSCSALNYQWNNSVTTKSQIVNQANLAPGGTYQALVTHPINTGCFVWTSPVHIVFVTPSASISGITSICAGGNTTLTANAGNSYLWSNGATTQSINVTNAGPYTVTVTLNGGCSASATTSVTVGGAVASISGVTSLCNGAATTLTASQGQSYLWSNGATTQNLSVNTAGSYTVTVTQAGGCTASASATVTVNANPSPSITGNNVICQGANTSFNAGAGYTGYLWSTTATSQSITAALSGTYSVTVTDANGCTGTASVNLTVNALPTPSISGTTTLCQGQTTTLNAGGPYAGYAWSTAASTQSISTGNAGTFTVTVTDANGCTGSASTAVTVNPNPSPSITGTLAFCQGTGTTLNAGGPFTGYLWTGGSTAQTLNVTVSGTFTVTVTDANGCTGTASATTTANSLPTPSITGTNVICQGANTSFNAGAGYASYQWSTAATTQSITATAAGPYAVTVTDANGCTGSASVNLTVNALPTPSITGITTLCQGASTTLSAGGPYAGYAWSTSATTQTITTGASGTFTVTVTDANGCVSSASTTVTVNNNPSPAISGTLVFCSGTGTTLSAGGPYASYQWNSGATAQTINVTTGGAFTVTVTDANGCTGSASATTTVNALPTPSISGATAICQNATTVFNAGGPYASYLWSTTATSQSITTGTAGPYTVSVTDGNGCTGSATVALTVNALPTPSITGNTTFCQGASSVLNAGGGYSSYAWSNAATTQTVTVSTGGPFTVTVTDANGCVSSASTNVTVNANPVPAIAGVLDFCAGTSTVLDAGSGYATYQWSNNATSQTISVGATGAFTVTVTDANGCTGSASANTTQHPLPTPSVTGNNVICQNDIAVFDAGAGYATYLWSGNATTQTLTTGIAGTYTVTVTDLNGCTGTASVTLTVNPLPIPSISGNLVFCQGSSSVLNAGAGFASYAWSSGASSQNITVNASGTYTVTVTSAAGCVSSTNAVVTVNNNPVPTITGPLAFCDGSSTVLDAGAGYTLYQWSNGATSQTVTVSTAVPVAVTVTDANGCVGTTSVNTVVNPLPTPAISGNNVICQNETTVFDAGAGYAAYAWSNSSSGQTLTTGIAGTYTVTVTDANGCTGTASMTLTVNPLPTPAISGNLAFCQGDNSTLSANAGYTAYQWSNTASTQSINVTAGGNYVVTVTDNNGCSASATAAVTVHPLPTPVIAGPNDLCAGATATLSAGNYAAYAWSTGATTPTLTTGAAGTYSVTVTDMNGCVSTSPAFAITVHPLPTASITQSSEICVGEPTAFNLVFTGTGPFTYNYTANGVPAIGNAPGASATVTVSPSATTVYALVSVTDAHCTNAAAGNVTVTVHPLPTPSITGIADICDGETSTFTANAGYVSYLWSSGQSTPSITIGTSGTYVVTVTDNNGCANTAASTLNVHMVPVIAFTNDSSLSCEETRVHFFNQSAFDPGSVFAWEFGDGSTGSEQDPFHGYTVSGTYPVTLTITTPYGCTATLSKDVEIIIYPLPVADFKLDRKEASIVQSQITAFDNSQNAVTWSWDFGDTYKTTGISASHYYSEEGRFIITLEVTNVSGCLSRASQEVYITPFFVPNAFTPNGDGLNDRFFDGGYLTDLNSYEMTIFNRWGKKVFANSRYNDFWNGRDLSGNPVPEGTYVYLIKAVTKDNKELSYEGRVTVVR